MELLGLLFGLAVLFCWVWVPVVLVLIFNKPIRAWMKRWNIRNDRRIDEENREAARRVLRDDYGITE